MSPSLTVPSTDPLRTAHEALHEAGLARQAILAHERQCVERSRDAAKAFERMGQELRAFMAQTRDARARLHDRVDQTQDRITENQVQVLEGFAALFCTCFNRFGVDLGGHVGAMMATFSFNMSGRSVTPAWSCKHPHMVL